MQSGKKNTEGWCLEIVPVDSRYIEPVMGWTGSRDTKTQLKLYFDNKEDAIAYAARENIECTVTEPAYGKAKIQSYTSNFAHKHNA
jgi:hypothetical protein